MIALPVLVLLAGVLVHLARRRTEGSVGGASLPLPWTPTVVVRVPRRWPAVRDLARVEARRLALHPLVLGGGAICLLAVGAGAFAPDGQPYFELTGTGGMGLYLPTLTFLAAHLNATRTRRTGADEVLAPAATSIVDRTLASCLAGVYFAAGVLAAVVTATVVYRIAGADLPRWPGPFEVVLLPLAVLGAVTLGTMVGRWLPWRGVGPPFLVLLIAVTGMLVGDLGADARYFATYVDLIDWEARGPVSLPTHLVAGHALYLLGLDAMAVVGAVLHDSRARVWWALGFAAVVWTAAMGAWQVS